MKLAISNIGWRTEQDEAVYVLMKKYGFTGLEIAPTRIFPKTPYEKLTEARKWADALKKDYGFDIPSMQSIWFGRQERIFGSAEERNILFDYTKKAIDFAAAITCGNLVFGCPRNRNLTPAADAATAVLFFKELGDYAFQKGTVIGMEANPPIYNTNYINDTASALKLIQTVDSKGFRLNLDLGTMIHNQEPLEILYGNVKWMNHIHISEPGLKPLKERKLHTELKKLLAKENYQRFVSIEMGSVKDISVIEEKLRYLSSIFSNE